MSDKNDRIAIVFPDKCKPKKCKQECRKGCPVVKTGKLCIEVEPTSKISFISETLCIGCGICVKKCPFDAINIINLPKSLDSKTTHRYSSNSFKLHGLPTPRSGQVLGLVGSNGIGKSTALKILAGRLKPNLGNFDDPPDWEVILKYFRGSELQFYFTKLLEDNIKAIIKPQYVDNIPKALEKLSNKMIGDILLSKLEKKEDWEIICNTLNLEPIMKRTIGELSGGELQRFTIAISCIQKANVYMFDEPSSYLDVKQRLRAAEIIRSLLKNECYVICVEHDLSVLDYLSDFVCILYGSPSMYGVVTMPSSVREGINIFLDGHIPSENMRFRKESLQFRLADPDKFLELDHLNSIQYPSMKKTLKDFVLEVEGGNFTNSEIIVMLGENGTGKTTFCKLISGLMAPDDKNSNFKLRVSMKPQKIAPKFLGTVRQLFFAKIRAAFFDPQFQSDVIKPLNINDIIDQEVKVLSGGELQKIAIILCLGVPADVYLIDEPSAYLDSEQRIVCSKIIRRFILHLKKTAFVVEHDFIMSTYLADKIIIFEGTPSKKAIARKPQSLLSGCNKFLSILDVSFRRDSVSFRPRINKKDSQLDKSQKSSGNYFFLENSKV